MYNYFNVTGAEREREKYQVFFKRGTQKKEMERKLKVSRRQPLLKSLIKDLSLMNRNESDDEAGTSLGRMYVRIYTT